MPTAPVLLTKSTKSIFKEIESSILEPSLQGLISRIFQKVSRHSKINLIQLSYQEMLALQLGRLGPSLRNLAEEEEVVQNQIAIAPK